MHTIPGIHLSIGTRQPATLTSTAGRHHVRAELGNWLQATLDSRFSPAHSHARHDSGVTVLFEGYLGQMEGPANQTPPAARIRDAYLASGLDVLVSLRGSYTGLILDERTQQAHLFNDRRASRPLYLRQDPAGRMLAGPEVARLVTLEPALDVVDPVAVCEFVLFASYYDDRTLFPSIRKLPPASVTTFTPEQCATRRYWEIRIPADKPASDEQAWVEQALDRFDRSTRRLLPDRSRPFLFLSGGMDSRMILGSLRQNGFVMPTVSYGTQEGDDMPTARQLAESSGFPFRPFGLSLENPQDHFLDAVLRSDCQAETVDTPALGALFDQLAPEYDTFLQGDKCFLGNPATTPDDALIHAGVLSFSQALRFGDMLEPTVYRTARECTDDALRSMRDAQPGIDPQDLRDKLYFEQRLVNRQNGFTAAKLRQFEQVRPWLDEDLVDTLFAMPGHLRTNKLLVRKMLESAWPDLAGIPFASKDSIPQSSGYRQAIPRTPKLADFIRSQFKDRLDDRIAGLFRPGVLDALIGSLLEGSAYPLPQPRWWHTLPGLWKIPARRYLRDRVHPIRIMLRLMQVNLYLGALKSRTATTAPS